MIANILRGDFHLAGSGVLYGVGNSLQRLVGVCLLPIYSEYISPDEFGVIGLLIVLPLILVPIFSLGLSSSISICYFGVETIAERTSVMTSAIFITTVSALALTIVSAPLLDFISSLVVGSPQFIEYVAVVILTVSFTVLLLPLQLEQQFQSQPVSYFSISLLGAGVTLFVGLYTILVLDLGGLGILISNLSGQMMVWLSLTILRRFKNIALRLPSKNLGKQLVFKGIQVLPSFVFLFLIQSAVRWPLEWEHGSASVGIYTIGYSLGSSITMFTAGLVAAWTPWAMRLGKQWEENKNILGLNFERYIYCGGFSVFLFFVLSQPITMILASDKYFEAWSVVGLSAMSNFLVSVFSILLPPVYLARKVYLVLVSQILAAVVTVIAIFFLLPFGVIGSGAAVVLGALSMVIIQLVVNVCCLNVTPMPISGQRISSFCLFLAFACVYTFSFSAEVKWGYFELIGLTVTMFLITVYFFGKAKKMVSASTQENL